MTELVLTGLDGSNPLAFLSALGVLNILSDRRVPAFDPDGSEPHKEAKSENGRVARRRAASLSTGLESLKHPAPDDPPPTLSWRDEGIWRPVVNGSFDHVDSLIDVLMEDLRSWKDEPARHLRYAKGKASKGKKPKEAWDLKAPPDEFRRFARELVKQSAGPSSRRGLDFLAAFATETSTDNNGNTKPTALHFTAGQQEFLGQVDKLVTGVTSTDLREALIGPWRYERPLPVLGWDSTTARDYALRADDPAKDKKQGVPGADWLAFRGLSFIGVAARGNRALTFACHGRGNDFRFRWPLWGGPLERDTIRTLVTLPGIGGPDEITKPSVLSERERKLRGVEALYECAIRRYAQGYGSFSAPARL